MHNLLERMEIQLPQYYPLPENWKNRGRMIVTFKPFWRNVPGLKNYPFSVGDRVRFHIHTEKPGEGNNWAHHVVHEIMDDTRINQTIFEETDVDIEGTPVSTEGNLRFTLGILNLPHPLDPLIMTANVQNKDRWWLGCAGLLIGAILGLCTGIILALLQIDKAWHIWSPVIK